MYYIENFNQTYNNLTNFKLSIVTGGVLHADSKWNFKGVSSPFNRLYFMIDGQAFVKHKNDYIPLIKNHCYLIPAGMECDYNCNNEFTKLFFHINIEIVDGLDLFDGTNKILKIKIDKKVSQKIIEGIRNDSLASYAIAKSELYSIIGQFLGISNISLNQNLLLKYKKLYEFISNNLSAELKVEDIANGLFVNSQTLSKSFKKDKGLALKKQIEIILHRKIKSLLITTDLTIKAIALQLNFSDQFYLSRFFKKMEGITPSQYRAKNKLNDW